MAVKTLYFKNVTVNGALSLQDGGTAPTAALTATGWTVGKLASGNFSLMVVGTKRATTAFSTTDALGTPSFSATSCWRSETPYFGTFANTTWTLRFHLRAVSAAASQRGRVNFRVWKSASADGSGATQLTSAPITGGQTLALTTTASGESFTTWTTPGTFVFNNEYLWIQCEWQVTTASGNNSGDAVFYVEDTASITTPDFVGTPIYAQKHFRFRTGTDIVNNATPTWAQPEDVSIPSGSYAAINYRLRISVENTGAGSPANTWTLRYSKNGGAYTAITTSSSVVQAVDASTSVDDTQIANQLLTASSGFFAGSGTYSETGTTPSRTPPGFGDFVEFEYGIKVVAADVANGDTIDFQIWPDTTAAITQTVTPRITVAVSAGVTGAGALAAGAGAIAGAGISSSAGAGALVAGAAVLAGSGSVAAAAITGAGALVASSAAIAGSGVSASAGTGALVAGSATAAGVGTSTSAGTGALGGQAAALVGVGASASTGDGALVAAAAALAGTGTAASPAIDGTGALVAGSAAIAGAGASASVGTGTLVAATAVIAGDGTSASAGNGSLVAGAAEIAGSGAVLAAGDAVAPGATLPLTLALLSGAASGEGVQPPIAVIGRPLRLGAIAPGAVLPLWLELVAGRVAADAAPRGAVLPLVRTTVVAGQATGEGQTDYDNDLVLLLAA